MTASADRAEPVDGPGPSDQVHSHQLCSPSGARVTGDVARRPLVGDPALLDDHHLVREDHGVDRVVGDHDRAAATRPQKFGKVAPQFLSGRGIKVGERLVEQQE